MTLWVLGTPPIMEPETVRLLASSWSEEAVQVMVGLLGILPMENFSQARCMWPVWWIPTLSCLFITFDWNLSGWRTHP